LSALHKANQLHGVEYQSRCRVEHIQVVPEGFNVSGFTAKKIVLCAGLDNQRLGKQLDMHLPVSPVKGQTLIT
jgi:glycine/D-amino acid oxidase-like deaminating enzyme